MDKIGQRAASVKRKRIISLLICMLLVLNVVCLTGCGAGKKWKDGKCTISIECSSILDNMEDLKETKKEFKRNSEQERMDGSLKKQKFLLKAERLHLMF